MTDPFQYDVQFPLRAALVRAGTTLLVVILFHIGLVIPVPGLTLAPGTLASLLEGYTLIKLHNHLIAGGGLHVGVGVFALGFLPYLQADALLRLVMLLAPTWKQQLEAPISGERLQQRWSLLLTLLFALFDAGSFVIWLTGSGTGLVETLLSQLQPILILVGGAIVTLLLLRFANRWTLAPGVALLSASNVTSSHFSELIVDLPALPTSVISAAIPLATVALALLLIWFTIGFYAAQGQVPIRFAQHNTSRRRLGSSRPFIPLPLDHARSEAIVNAAMMVGFAPLLIKLFPIAAPNIATQIQDPHNLLYVILVLLFMALFSLLYTMVNLDAIELADRLKRQGSFIPGVRPGRETVSFLKAKISRLAILGIIFKGLLFLGIWGLFRLGWLSKDPILVMSTLIVLINLGELTLRRVQAQIAMGSYEGLLRKPGQSKRWWQWLLD